ncbi:MAG: hypothetical protein EP305_06265 [Bacteroidetes bacterium]|nr:MAG: hypothetical protein EP305_06265 [Bacteroidota bacterium]
MIKELIDKTYRTQNFPKNAELFIREPRNIPELVNVAISDLSHPYPEYASWLLIHISKEDTRLLIPFQEQLIDRILTSDNQSVLRNLVNTIQTLPLIDYRESELLNRLIIFISDDRNKVALFVYALYKLIQFVKKYPEIDFEIKSILSLKQEPLKPAMRVAIRNYNLALFP